LTESVVSWRKIVVGIAVGIAGLTAALWGVSLADIGAAFASLDAIWLLPIAAVFLLQQVLRAARQMVLLQVVQPNLTYRNSLAILCISFFCINTLPARIGEVVRPLLLLERERIPLGAGFGLVFLERSIDLIAVLLMLASVLAWVPLPGTSIPLGGTEIDMGAVLRHMARSVVPVIVLGPILLVVFRKSIMALGHRVETVLAPFRFAGRIWALGLRFAETFLTSLTVLRSPIRLFVILALTAATWMISGWMYVWLAAALGIGDHVTWGHGMGILVITMLGTMVPSPPGFAGVYEAFCRGALALCGVSGDRLDAVAVAFALVIHWWQYSVQSTTAIFFLWRDGLSFKYLADLVRRGVREIAGAKVASEG